MTVKTKAARIISIFLGLSGLMIALLSGCATLFEMDYFTGAPLQLKTAATVETGLAPGQHHDHYGMSAYMDNLYLIGWSANKITAISLIDQTLVKGYPKPLAKVSGPHGIAVDAADGSVWICDLNNKSLRHYSQDIKLLESKQMGSEIVNVMQYGSKLFVADRGGRGTLLLVDKNTLNIEKNIEFSAHPSDNHMGDMDLFVYKNRLYVCGTNLNGILEMNLDGTQQKVLPVDGLGRGGAHARGIYVYKEKIFINAANKILVTDLTGDILVDYPLPLESREKIYTDLYLDRGRLYVASHMNTDAPHVLVLVEASAPK